MGHDFKRAWQFGEDPKQYDRARPSYPSQLVDDLTLGCQLNVLDVGCGTGIAGRLFLERGCTVVGVEHDPRMAEVARESGIEVDVSTFEAWIPPTTEFGLVISAQAWHWIDPTVGPLKAAEVLSLGGNLAIIWIEYHHQPEVAEAFSTVYGSVAPQLLDCSYPVGNFDPEHASQVAAEYVDAIDGSGAFDTPSLLTYSSDRTYTIDQWLDELPTHSDHRLLPPRKLADLISRLRESLQPLGGSLTATLSTHAVVAQRSGPRATTTR